MISKNRKYFTLFGMLAATVDRQISSFYSLIGELMALELPKITNILMSRQLRPVKQVKTTKQK